MQKKYLIIIVGPTAIGKTALSIELAKIFNSEIISADSRQFYKEISIGTAKPTTQELSSAVHHFVDFLSVKDSYNVGQYENDTIKFLNNYYETNDIAILVGGSGLYINALCYGFDELPEISQEIRLNLNAQHKQDGIEGLQKKLLELDPEYYSIVDINNPQRIIRALEVCLSTGKPFSSFRKGKISHRPFTTIKIGLNLDRESLYKKINLRVENMIDEGLIDEASNMHPLKNLNALQTVGYRELFDYFEGTTDLQSAINLIKQNTRHYAKRQLTWFRKDKEIEWFSPKHIKEIVSYIRRRLNA